MVFPPRCSWSPFKIREAKKKAILTASNKNNKATFLTVAKEEKEDYSKQQQEKDTIFHQDDKAKKDFGNDTKGSHLYAFQGTDLLVPKRQKEA